MLLDKSTIKPYEITYWMGVATFVAMFILLKILEYKEKSKGNRSVDLFKVPEGARVSWLMRGIFGWIANIALTASYQFIPLSRATVLFFTAPIWIGVFGTLILKEKITTFDKVGIAITFIGVYIFTMDPFSSSK